MSPRAIIMANWQSQNEQGRGGIILRNLFKKNKEKKKRVYSLTNFTPNYVFVKMKQKWRSIK